MSCSLYSPPMRIIIGVTAAKVVPCTIGSLAPNPGNPTACIRVATPHMKKLALMMYTSCSGGNPMAVATIKGTAMILAYIVITCCKPNAANRPGGNTSSTGCTARPSLLSTLSSDISLPFPLNG